MTKIHAIVNGRGKPLVLAVTPGQDGHLPALVLLLAELRVPRQGPDRPRSTPDALRVDKAYSSWATRTLLRSRGITAVTPEPADQLGHRKNRSSRGGRPVNVNAEGYKGRNVIERAFSELKNWRGLATRYDDHALIHRGGMVLASIALWLHA